MADIDRQKEIISSYRVIFTILFTSLLGIIGYLLVNYSKLNELQLFFSFIGLNILIIGVGVVTIKMVKAIDKLGELKWYMQYLV